MATQRQTQSYLRDLFARRGVFPRHQFGQNFLIDLNIHELIVKTAEVGPGDAVLEVGPGAGALTALMARRGATVVAAEIDPAMAALTGEAVSGMPNVRVLNLDALARKNEINPEVLDQIRSALAVASDRKFKLVANLPYNVATPIISNLLVHPDPALHPERMVVTIQRELADRMIAEPGSNANGALSITVQALADVSLVRTLPPNVFWPRPKVDSAVVLIKPNAEKRGRVGDVPRFHNIVRRLFLLRRKNLRVAIHSTWPDSLSKTDADALLEKLGLNGQVRAEAMNVEEFVSLVNALKERIGAPAPVSETEADS